MRAVQASTFGAPPSSLVVEDPRVGAAAGSGSSPRTLHRLLPHRSERSEAGGAGGAGGASDSGSDTAASVDASVVGTGASWSQELHDHPHVQQVRRWGHSLKGHMESLLAD
jgi:hypothetical protein